MKINLHLLSMILLGLSLTTLKAQSFKTVKNGGVVSFFSETPVENISAKTSEASSLIRNDSVFFLIPIKKFVFEKALMQEHFNENYMESSKYPNSTFKGKIGEEVNFSKNGTYQVSCNGKLLIHGVERNATMRGQIIVNGSEVRIKSAFDVKLVDHKIDVPQIVMVNIAEVIHVKVDALYAPFEPKKK